eukprot:GHVS01098081.1.p2 GENE.GHVS01098081.1~~GHVS01098081.1.p2  ORF type:complete len:296 (+),score=47.59 GHVS01098081.1:128-1015(+)
MRGFSLLLGVGLVLLALAFGEELHERQLKEAPVQAPNKYVPVAFQKVKKSKKCKGRRCSRAVAKKEWLPPVKFAAAPLKKQPPPPTKKVVFKPAPIKKAVPPCVGKKCNRYLKSAPPVKSFPVPAKKFVAAPKEITRVVCRGKKCRRAKGKKHSPPPVKRSTTKIPLRKSAPQVMKVSPPPTKKMPPPTMRAPVLKKDVPRCVGKNCNRYLKSAPPPVKKTFPPPVKSLPRREKTVAPPVKKNVPVIKSVPAPAKKFVAAPKVTRVCKGRKCRRAKGKKHSAPPVKKSIHTKKFP